MRSLLTSTMVVLAAYSPAHAADGGSDRIGILGILFIAFGVMVIVAQLIPGLVLLVSLIRGLFGKPVAQTDANER